VLSAKPLADTLVWLARRLAFITRHPVLRRQVAFFATGNVLFQSQVFHPIERQYPGDTVFVVLPMDMAYFKLGPVREDIDAQHDELLALAAEYPGRVLPFYAVDPRRDDVIARARQNLVPDKFRGVKIYPNGGYPPTDEKLMGVYALCEERNLPVMAHCSPVGVWRFGLNDQDRRGYSHPDNYKTILTRFPRLRLCLAHFGGSDEWDKQLAGKTARSGEEATWVEAIAGLIRSGDYPNLYTDISYLIFQHAGPDVQSSYIDYLKVLLEDERLRDRVLFGSDFYMVKREAMTEKSVSIALRSRLGEDLYFKIAHHNPRRYLGLQP
jgi:predicted TIM-barrel fold metal-dependent hydrolase